MPVPRRILLLVGVALCAAPFLAVPASARILAQGVDRGVSAVTPVISIVDDPPLGDVLEFQLFYAANAGNGQTMDYDGMAPILESDLVLDGAHLFFLEKGGELAFFVVYKRDAGQQSADGRLSTAANFVIGDVIVRDAAGDSYAIDAGDIVTTHQITVGGRTDGYVATLSGRSFDVPGDVMTFDFATPAAGTTDLPFTSIQVFTGVDTGGSPIWVEIDGGPFSSTTSRRVEFTRVPQVPAISHRGPVLAALLLMLALAVPWLRRRSPAPLSRLCRP